MVEESRAYLLLPSLTQPTTLITRLQSLSGFLSAITRNTSHPTQSYVLLPRPTLASSASLPCPTLAYPI